MFNYNDGSMLGASILAIIFTWLIVFISVYAIVAIPKWKLFEKAGRPGWGALIPYYNEYVLYDITWGNGVLFLLSLIPGAGLVFWIITRVKMAQAYGKGGGFACGLVFLYIIFLYIMAFSDDIVYIGVPGNAAAYGAGGGQTGYQQPGYQNPYSQGYQQQGYQNPYGYQQQTNPQNTVKYCVNCGIRLENNEKFCPKCGKEQ